MIVKCGGPARFEPVSIVLETRGELESMVDVLEYCIARVYGENPPTWIRGLLQELVYIKKKP